MLAADERKENFGELPGDYLCRLSQETENERFKFSWPMSAHAAL